METPNKDRIAREELYKLVWQQPLSKLATLYGVSDVALVKICKRMRVPRPPQGYWLRSEKPLPRPLPPLEFGGESEVWLMPEGERKQCGVRSPKTTKVDEVPLSYVPPSIQNDLGLVSLLRELSERYLLKGFAVGKHLYGHPLDQQECFSISTNDDSIELDLSRGPFGYAVVKVCPPGEREKHRRRHLRAQTKIIKIVESERQDFKSKIVLRELDDAIQEILKVAKTRRREIERAELRRQTNVQAVMLEARRRVRLHRQLAARRTAQEIHALASSLEETDPSIAVWISWMRRYASDLEVTPLGSDSYASASMYSEIDQFRYDLESEISTSGKPPWWASKPWNR